MSAEGKFAFLNLVLSVGQTVAAPRNEAFGSGYTSGKSRAANGGGNGDTALKPSPLLVFYEGHGFGYLWMSLAQAEILNNSVIGLVVIP